MEIDMDMIMQNEMQMYVNKLQAVKNTVMDFNPEDIVYQATTVAGLVTDKTLILGVCLHPIHYQDANDNQCSKIQFLLKQIGQVAIPNCKVSSSLLGIRRRRAIALIRLKCILFNRTDALNAAVKSAEISADQLHEYKGNSNRNMPECPYASVGIGQMIVMSLFKNSWKPNISKENAERLVFDAISTVNLKNSIGAGKIKIYHLE